MLSLVALADSLLEFGLETARNRYLVGRVGCACGLPCRFCQRWRSVSIFQNICQTHAVGSLNEPRQLSAKYGQWVMQIDVPRLQEDRRLELGSRHEETREHWVWRGGKIAYQANAQLKVCRKLGVTSVLFRCFGFCTPFAQVAIRWPASPSSRRP